MLMNPQYPPSCYADIMYRNQIPAPFLSSGLVNPPPALPVSSAALHSNHPSYHVFHNNNTTPPEFFMSGGGGGGSLSGSCYTPTPPPSEHGLMASDTSRADSLAYGYGSAPMDSNHHLYSSPVASIWHSPQHPGVDEKRGSVIMGQPLSQPPPKRKGGRKPKDDPNLPPAERQKRILRRLRNKEAAAKCRERRMNHTSGLLKQIEDMERQQKQYEEQITNLRLNKHKCEKLLDTHRRDCDKRFIVPSGAAASTVTTTNSNTSSPASTMLLPPATTCSSIDSHSGSTTPNSISTNNSHSNSYPPINYQQNLVSAATTITTTAASTNRRKQTTPKLSLDTSCAASHRLSSSSSNGDLHSPLVMP